MNGRKSTLIQGRPLLPMALLHRHFYSGVMLTNVDGSLYVGTTTCPDCSAIIIKSARR
jgi:hypothetical protein